MLYRNFGIFTLEEARHFIGNTTHEMNSPLWQNQIMQTLVLRFAMFGFKKKIHIFLAKQLAGYELIAIVFEYHANVLALYFQLRLFEKMLMEAALDAGVQLRQIESRAQSPDHPEPA